MSKLVNTHLASTTLSKIQSPASHIPGGTGTHLCNPSPQETEGGELAAHSIFGYARINIKKKKEVLHIYIWIHIHI